MLLPHFCFLKMFVPLCYNQFFSPDSNDYSCTNADFFVVVVVVVVVDACRVLNLVHFPSTYWSLSSQSQPLRPSLCHVRRSFKKNPSGRCATAPSSVCSDTDGFRKQIDHTNRF